MRFPPSVTYVSYGRFDVLADGKLQHLVVASSMIGQGILAAPADLVRSDVLVMEHSRYTNLLVWAYASSEARTSSVSGCLPPAGKNMV